MSDTQARLTVREAARRLGVHENTIRNWIRAGYLNSVTLPGSGYHRIPEDEVERLIRSDSEQGES